jgi:uncharacterized membrane protein
VIESKSSKWLIQLGCALARLPEADRDEIVRETRSHIEERLAGGRSVEEVLSSFGEADRYARQFTEESEAHAALDCSRTTDLALFVLGRAHRHAFAAGAVLLVAALSSFALLAFITIVLKIADPRHTGLWQGSDFTFLGVIDQPEAADELLGLWLFPVSAAVVLFVLVICRFVLSFTARVLLSDVESHESRLWAGR